MEAIKLKNCQNLLGLISYFRTLLHKVYVSACFGLLSLSLDLEAFTINM